MNEFKIICENGDYWHTGFNGDLEAAERYFIGLVKVYENFENGKETKTKVIQVVQVNTELDEGDSDYFG
jgi:hypothetical protein